MATDTTAADITANIWERVLRFEERPSAAAARALLKLQFADSDRERMRELSAKARAGRLTAAEEDEAETYERLGCLLDVLHSHARQIIKPSRSAP